MNTLKNYCLAAAAVVAVLLGSAGASQAASSRCNTGITPPKCTTGAIPANSTDHFVHVSVTSWQTFYLHDTETHVIVYSGTNGIWGTEHTVTGLYGQHYVGEINNVLTSVLVGGHITISNT